MQIPTIHLNGTSKEELVEALCNARAAIDDAITALRKTTPNGRDYYPQGPKATEWAVAEHSVRVHKLMEVRDEIEELAVAINEGGS